MRVVAYERSGAQALLVDRTRDRAQGVTAPDTAQRLERLVEDREGASRPRSPTPRRHEPEERSRIDHGKVAGERDDSVVASVPCAGQRGLEAPERAAIGAQIGKVGRASHHDPVAYRSERAHGPLHERSSPDPHLGLRAPEPAAFAAREHDPEESTARRHAPSADGSTTLSAPE